MDVKKVYQNSETGKTEKSSWFHRTINFFRKKNTGALSAKTISTSKVSTEELKKRETEKLKEDVETNRFSFPNSGDMLD
jgi:hypothetical protein